ncbi:response regulator [Legionella spiritensis]|uniref:Two component response regulator n=1 Tax=Legionella spiritensis TaxID=452 RepID=A0A0W0Z8G9_LEGSP|nr:response regulator [Legionella spiritensis]KTD65279.1 two component response regulator [Legionella spiritensis]SNV30128.1 two component response regulator [Legionella spiritensis]
MDVKDCVVDILYVEDDDVDILKMQREFSKVSNLLKIAVCTDAIRALDMLYGRNKEKKITPKIILLDISLPKINGIEFLETLRSDTNFMDIRVFILTGAYSTKEKLVMEQLKVMGHIIKPIEYKDALNIFWTLQENSSL